MSGSPRHPNAHGEIPIRPDNRVFADGRDRQVCIARQSVIPEAFPVNHRPVSATGRLHVVASSGDSLLYCDGAHTGPCEWPLHVTPEPSSLTTRSPRDEEQDGA